MNIQIVISLLIVVFVIVGAIYDVEWNREGRALHSAKYRWRRLQNWFPMGVAYAAFYMARYNVAAGNVPSVREELKFSAAFMGWTLSAGSWSYALTAPFTGQVTDRIGGKNGMVLACLGAAMCNLALGVVFLSGLPLVLEQILFIVMYAGNVLVQGFGTSAVVKINAAWYSPRERGIFAGVFNIMLTSGYFLSLGTGSSIISSFGWAYVFIVPGLVLVSMTIAIAFLVQNTPQDSTKAINNMHQIDLEPRLSTEQGISPGDQMKRLLRNCTFLGYLAAVFFLSWVRDGFLNWFLSFFDAVRSQELTSADTAIIGGAWTIGGFVGGVLCGWVSDTLFQSDRVLPICIFSGIQAVLLAIVYLFSATCSIETLGVLVFFCSVFVLGNYTLLSYAVPSDLPQDIAAGASGILTCIAYFSTGLSGACMGEVIQSGGYLLWIASLMVASILTGLFTATGSYFSKEVNGMMLSEAFIQENDVVIMERDTTPLSSRSQQQRRASIVRISDDFIVSPLVYQPTLSINGTERSFHSP